MVGPEKIVSCTSNSKSRVARKEKDRVLLSVVLMMPLSGVELSITSLYIYIVLLPVGGHCAPAGAGAPLWKRIGAH